MKKWIAVCGGPLCGSIITLLHIAVIFKTHGERNVAIFFIIFPFIKVFKENKYCQFFQTVLPIFYFIIRLNVDIHYNCNVYRKYQIAGNTE